ncbi:MAG: hypothetical protein QXG86_02905 [Candidatus Woesearchaeota archaeon]
MSVAKNKILKIVFFMFLLFISLTDTRTVISSDGNGQCSCDNNQLSCNNNNLLCDSQPINCDAVSVSCANNRISVNKNNQKLLEVDMPSDGQSAYFDGHDYIFIQNKKDIESKAIISTINTINQKNNIPPKRIYQQELIKEAQQNNDKKIPAFIFDEETRKKIEKGDFVIDNNNLNIKIGGLSWWERNVQGLPAGIIPRGNYKITFDGNSITFEDEDEGNSFDLKRTDGGAYYIVRGNHFYVYSSDGLRVSSGTTSNNEIATCKGNTPPPCIQGGAIRISKYRCIGAGNDEGVMIDNNCMGDVVIGDRQVKTVTYTTENGEQICICTTYNNNGVCNKMCTAAKSKLWQQWVGEVRMWQSFGSNIYSMLEQFKVDPADTNWEFLQKSKLWFENSILGRALTLDEQLICRTHNNFDEAVKKGFLPTETGRAGADIQAYRSVYYNVTNLTSGIETMEAHKLYKVTFNVDASALFSPDLVKTAQVGKLKFYVTLDGTNIISNETVGEIGINGIIELDVEDGPAAWGTSTLGKPIIYKTDEYLSEACIVFTEGIQYMTGFVQSFLEDSGNKVCNSISDG